MVDWRLSHYSTNVKMKLPLSLLLVCTVFTLVRGQAQQAVGMFADEDSIVSDQEMANWKALHGVKPSYNLALQQIQDEVTFPDGSVVSLDDLEPLSIYSPRATCQVDDENIPCPTPSVSTKTTDSHKIIVSKSEDGQIKSIKAKSLADGSMQLLQSINGAALTYIPTDAVDTELEKKFITQSTTPEEQMRRNLRQVADEMDPTTTPHRNLQGQCTEYREIEVAVAAESTLCADAGSWKKTALRIEEIMADVALEYEHDDLCFTVVITHAEIFCDAYTDPYRAGVELNKSGCGSDGLLQYFQQFWEENRTEVHRDMAQLLSGTGLECFPNGACAIGCAYKFVTCRNPSFSYGVNWVTYTHDATSLCNLVAHEMGHNVGAHHDDTSTNNIMFSMNGYKERAFGPITIHSFLDARNDACITTPEPSLTTTTTNAATTTTSTVAQTCTKKKCKLHNTKNPCKQDPCCSWRKKKGKCKVVKSLKAGYQG